MQRREIDGFDFDNVERTQRWRHILNFDIAELVYHGSSHATNLSATAIALRLADLIDFRRGELRFKRRLDLCRAFRIDPLSEIIITGVDHDSRIEPWWSLGSDRIGVIKGLFDLGIRLVSTPNFSVLLDNPRTDDLHAMKRIAITFAEFQQGGLSCALHTNGRTAKDFERWSRFIMERPEVEILAYEFITGPGQAMFKSSHLARLAYLAQTAQRELDIIVRGDPNVIPYLRKYFRNVIYIDTTAFVKAQRRQRASRVANHSLEWKPSPTVRGEPIDALFQHDVDEQLAYLRARYYCGEVNRARAA